MASIQQLENSKALYEKQLAGGNTNAQANLDRVNQKIADLQGTANNTPVAQQQTPQQTSPQNTQPKTTQQSTQTPTVQNGVQQNTAVRDNNGNIVRPDLLQQDAYQDDSEKRQQEIINNLNQARQTNVASLSDLNTFRNYYNYAGRTAQQKQTLDNWFFGYDQGRTLSQQTSRSLAEQYNAGAISQSQLDNLRAYDQSKYDATMQFVNQKSVLGEYNNALNPKASANPFQGIIDNYMKGLENVAQAPQFYNEYKDKINSQEMKEKMTQINDLNKQIEELDLDMTNARKTLEKKYEGTGISRGALNAIINDELFELQNNRSNLAIQMNSKVNQYNSQMQTIQQDMDMRMKDFQMQQSAEQAQMNKIGFVSNLMSFQTPQQKMDAEFDFLVRKQEYSDGNIYSSDPATRQKAITKAVDNILTEFKDIPMIRSREQMINDIKNLVDNGMSLGEAITKNIREPIQNKKEYKSWLQKKFQPATMKIGDKTYIQNANGEWGLPEIKGSTKMIDTYTASQIDLGNGTGVKVGQTVNMNGTNYRITQLGGSNISGIDFAPMEKSKKDPIGAFMGGEVIGAGQDKAVNGKTPNNYVEIKGDNGYVYRYNHLDSIDVKKGDRVDLGGNIGRMGTTGNSTGVHLDLAVYPPERATNGGVSPLNIVDQAKIVFGTSGGTKGTTGWGTQSEKETYLALVKKGGLTNTDQKAIADKAIAEGRADEYRNALKQGMAVDMSPTQTTQYNKAIDKFQSNPVVKGFEEGLTQYQSLAGALSDKSGPGDMAGVFAFMKTLDPTSVVRESEFKSAAKSAGVQSYRKNTYDRLSQGKILTQDQSDAFRRIATEFIKQKAVSYDRLYNDMTNQFNQFGIPTTLLPTSASQQMINFLNGKTTYTPTNTTSGLLYTPIPQNGITGNALNNFINTYR